MIAITTEGKEISVRPGNYLSMIRLRSVTLEYADTIDKRFPEWFTDFVVPRLVPKEPA